MEYDWNYENYIATIMELKLSKTQHYPAQQPVFKGSKLSPDIQISSLIDIIKYRMTINVGETNIWQFAKIKYLQNFNLANTYYCEILSKPHTSQIYNTYAC